MDPVPPHDESTIERENPVRVDSILEQTIYLTKKTEEDKQTYNTITQEEFSKQEKKPQRIGELYVFHDKQNNGELTIDIRIDHFKKGNILDIVNFVSSYLSKYQIEAETKLFIIIGEGTLRISYQEFLETLSDEEKRRIFEELPIQAELTTIRSTFEFITSNFLRDPNFINSFYQNPEEAIGRLKTEIAGKFRELSSIKEQELERLISLLREKLTKIAESVNKEKAVELLSLSEKEIIEKIAELSAIPNDFYQPLFLQPEEGIIASIDPKNIISAETRNTNTEGKNWADYFIDRSGKEIPYMKNLILSFLNGSYDFLNTPKTINSSDTVTLAHIGNGRYIVLTGRHRVIAAKLLDAKHICAEVLEIQVKPGEKRKVSLQFKHILDNYLVDNKIKGKYIEENGEIFFIFDEVPDPAFLFANPESFRKIIK